MKYKQTGNGPSRHPTQATKVYPGDVALISHVHNEKRYIKKFKKFGHKELIEFREEMADIDLQKEDILPREPSM